MRTKPEQKNKANSTNGFTASGKSLKEPKEVKEPNKTGESPKIINVPLPDISPGPEVTSEPGRKKRGSYKKSDGKVTPDREDLRPFFETLSVVLESFHAEKLSETEINTGMAAWFPVWVKYYPVLIDKMVWLPAMVWSAAVIVPRAKSFIPKKREEKSKE